MTTHLREKYVNPYTDFGFKKLFGTEMNKELLISFINSLLKGEEEIRDLTYLNTEHLGMREADRKAVFDVYCENERGEKILVEMQRGEQQFFKDRSLYYSTFPIREQGEKGEWNYELKTVYVIGILNFAIDDHKPDDYLRKVQLTDVQSKEVFYEKLTFIYLEMPKFNKREEELDGMFEKWLFVLRNLSRLMERPKALQLDYKLQLADQLVKATGLRSSEIEGKDNAEISLYLIQRWEDEEGNVYARRVGTAYHKFAESVAEWQNGYRIPIYYGDISRESCYTPEMALVLPDGPRYTTNSRGENVPIQVVGWADADAQPTHLMLRISSGDKGAFIGAVGTCFWIDNVSLVY